MNEEVFKTDQKQRIFKQILSFIYLGIFCLYPLNKSIKLMVSASIGSFFVMILDIVFIILFIWNVCKKESIKLCDKFIVIEKYKYFKKINYTFFYEDIECVYRQRNNVQINVKGKAYVVQYLNNSTEFINRIRSKGITAGNWRELRNKELSNIDKKGAFIVVLSLLIFYTSDLRGDGDYGLAIITILFVSWPLLFLLRKSKKNKQETDNDTQESEISLNKHTINDNCGGITSNGNEYFRENNLGHNFSQLGDSQIEKRPVNRKKEAIIGFIVLLILFGIGYLCKIHEQNKEKELEAQDNVVETVINLDETTK